MTASYNGADVRTVFGFTHFHHWIEWKVYILPNDVTDIFVICPESRYNITSPMPITIDRFHVLFRIHKLRVHNTHAAANLNSGYSKYAKVAHVHYFCTIALRTLLAVLARP